MTFNYELVKLITILEEAGGGTAVVNAALRGDPKMAVVQALTTAGVVFIDRKLSHLRESQEEDFIKAVLDSTQCGDL